MYPPVFREHLENQLQQMKEQGLYKHERIILSAQGPYIEVENHGKVLNFCANNYLGLSNSSELKKAATDSIEKYGYGLSSVRFICGTQSIHKELEKKVSQFLGMQDCILYAACFDANGGVFEPFLDQDCSIITDSLNHASIIDGIRLTKAKRLIYKNNDISDLEEKLKQSADSKFRLIATDGVFSMDGYLAQLDKICDLAEKYQALVMVDDSHATGVMGANGRGTPEHFDVIDRIDIMTTTFGKALGGALGGCTAGKKEMIDFLRQKSRPYLFSNSLAPAIVGSTMKAIELLSSSTQLRDQLEENTIYFRKEIKKLGFDIKEGIHPIVPVMLYDEKLAHQMADDLLDCGIYVIGFSYPVVPKGQARIRLQISASHTQEHLDKALDAFKPIGNKLGLISGI